MYKLLTKSLAIHSARATVFTLPISIFQALLLGCYVYLNFNLIFSFLYSPLTLINHFTQGFTKKKKSYHKVNGEC